MTSVADICFFLFPKRELGPLNRCCLVYYKRKVCSRNMYLHILEIFFLKNQNKKNCHIEKYTLKNLNIKYFATKLQKDKILN